MSMMRLNPRIGLSFDGQCEAAFHFYERCLNGRLRLCSAGANRRWPKMRQRIGAEVLHARLVIGDTALLGADVLPGSYQSPRGFSFTLGVDDPGETERLFNALSENGTVRMPLQETFWAPRSGVVIDQFGIQWNIQYEKPE